MPALPSTDQGLGFILHLIGTLRDKHARRKSFRKLPALLLDGRLVAGWLVEPLVSVVVAVCSKQAMVAPLLDGVGRDGEHGSSFAYGQQAAGAQALVAGGQAVLLAYGLYALRPGDDAVAGAQSALVQPTGTCRNAPSSPA